jgi:hypothetical protein
MDTSARSTRGKIKYVPLIQACQTSACDGLFAIGVDIT